LAPFKIISHKYPKAFSALIIRAIFEAPADFKIYYKVIIIKTG
jgi:hypothetical protein